MAYTIREQIKQVEEVVSAVNLIGLTMESCTMIDRTTVNDGIGGYKSIWTDGATFKASFVVDSSIEALTAQAQGVTALYTVTTSRAINLQYHDVFRREDDGKIFRVKSDGDDKKTPPSAGLDMRQVRAEEYTLPTD